MKGVPEPVAKVVKTLEKAGFEAYLVGGCVRDLVLGSEPKDWDVATNGKPEEIQKLFPDSVYENQFGTVGVKTPTPEEVGTPTLSVGANKNRIIEVTTFRLEGKYTDKRHPDEIVFAKSIEEDLSRRDFTVNALGAKLEGKNAGEILDPYGGQKDLKERIIRAVGDPEARFNEDALRLMRAVRFATELDFKIDPDARRAIEKLSGLLEAVAKERIRDELMKILMAPRAAQGIILLEELNLLRFILPELREGLGVTQNKHHIYTVFEHNLRSLEYAAKEGYSLVVRMSALLHDVGKPRVKGGDGPDSTFYGHDYVGAKMTLKMLDNLRFPKDFSEEVAHLVRHHMFYYNVGEVSPAGVRRFLARVGPETVDDLLKVREADRIGSGVPKAIPYKARHLMFMIDKVKKDPISPKMLKMDGTELMGLLELKPGPRVGWILSALLEEVLDDPEKNNKEHLESRAKELGGLSDKDLEAKSSAAREKKEEFESGVEEEMKKKHHVK